MLRETEAGPNRDDNGTMRPLARRLPAACPPRDGRVTALSLAGLLAVLLAGSQSPVRLMPTPVSLRGGDVDPFAHAGSHALRTGVPVLYATNRGAVVQTPKATT